MVDLEMLKQMRAAGVKSATFDGNDVTHVDFFPRSILDVSGLDAAEGNEGETERPPAPAEDAPPNMPPAFARILGKQSVS